MGWIKTLLPLIGGTISVYTLIAGLTIAGGILYHYYDKYVTVPIETAVSQQKTCEKDLTRIKEINTDLEKEFDANLSSVKEELIKCVDDNSILTKNAYDLGYADGIKSVKEMRHVKANDCFILDPHF